MAASYYVYKYIDQGGMRLSQGLYRFLLQRRARRDSHDERSSLSRAGLSSLASERMAPEQGDEVR
jgi:hypothetical protein